jgi:uncharacterized iron-regulated membrane protein
MEVIDMRGDIGGYMEILVGIGCILIIVSIASGCIWLINRFKG